MIWFRCWNKTQALMAFQISLVLNKYSLFPMIMLFEVYYILNMKLIYST